MSHSNFASIRQDKKGFLWFATNLGLNRYDGYEFKVFISDPADSNSLSDNRIFSLHCDDFGEIWIGTEKGGLNRYNPATSAFRHYMNNPDDPHSISDNFIYSIVEDKTGSLWIGTMSGGLNRFDRDKEVFHRYQPDDNDPYSINDNVAECILEDSYGNLWIGTRSGGLNLLDRETGRFSHYMNETGNPKSLSNNYVRDLYEDSIRDLWIATSEGGLNRFNRESGTFERFVHDPKNTNSISSNLVFSIVESDNKKLWIATGSGLSVMDLNTGDILSYHSIPDNSSTLSNDYITSLFIDKSDILWIGSLRGIDKLDLNQVDITHYYHIPGDESTISQNAVYGIYENSSGVLWVCTSNGLNRIDRKTGKIKRIFNDPENTNSLSANGTTAVLEDDDSQLWVGTQHGLNLVDYRNNKFRRFIADSKDPDSISDSFVLRLYQDRSGNIWVGTLRGGLNLYNRESGTFTSFMHDHQNPESIIDNSVYAMLETANGDFWIGTSGGLDKFDRDKGIFNHYINKSDDPNSLSSNRITSLLESEDGKIWISTRENGINLFDPVTGVFERFGVEHGLPNLVTYSILPDHKGSYWITTESKLVEFEPENQIFKQHAAINLTHDLKFNVLSYFRNSIGELVYGGPEGIYIISPENIELNEIPPETVITSVKVGSKEVHFNVNNPGETPIRIPYDENEFSISFAALDFTDPESNRFSYFLEGYDTEWQFNDISYIKSYMNLPYGEYKFRVTGSNSDGIWSNEQAVISIIVETPYWANIWFRVLAILGVILVLMAGMRSIVRYKVKVIQKRKNELESLVDERTVELKEVQEQLEERVYNRTRELYDANIMLTDEISERKKIEFELESSRRLLLILNEISNIFLTEEDDKIYSQILKAVVNATGSSKGFFGLLKDDRLSGPAVDINEGTGALDNETETSIILNEDESCTILKEPGSCMYANELKGSCNLFDDMNIAICSPLIHSGKVIGTLLVSDRKSRYDESDKDLLKRIGIAIAPIISMRIEKENEQEERKSLEHQLFQAQKLESIGRLAGGIAHDFNNILTSIMGYAELLKMKFDDLSTPEGHASEIILSGAERAADLTKQLLGFARGGKYNPVPLNINGVIKDAVRVSEKIFEKNISIHFKLSEDLNSIEADENQLNQILTNLIINARDAMPRGGKIEFMTENVQIKDDLEGKLLEISPGYYVKVTVSDTGNGMPREIQEQIFEPFFSTKKTGKGTGLGLATVYGIMKNHSGHIKVYSEEGIGTTFSLFFPCTDKELEAREHNSTYYIGDATILLIDDEEHVRNVAETMLESIGYTVISAENGSKGIETYNTMKDKIDLIILDLVMPVKDGRTTFFELKQENPDVNILLSSGFSSENKAEDLLNSGAVGFIQKPFKMENLSKTVRDSLL